MNTFSLQLESGNRYLICDIDRKRVSLANARKVSERGLRFGAICIDLLGAKMAFDRLTGGDQSRVFRSPDIMTITGMRAEMCDKWAQLKILKPTLRTKHQRGYMRLYSYHDAFIAGVVGALRRQNCPTWMLRKVSDFLTEIGQEKIVEQPAEIS